MNLNDGTCARYKLVCLIIIVKPVNNNRVETNCNVYYRMHIAQLMS